MQRLFYIFDTENTGLDRNRDEVLQIACVVTDGVNNLGEFSEHIRVSTQIFNRAVSEIGHIVRLEWEKNIEAREANDVYNNLVDFIYSFDLKDSKSIFVAHYADYDYDMICANIKRNSPHNYHRFINLFTRNNLFDTIDLAKLVFAHGQIRSNKLDNIAQYIAEAYNDEELRGFCDARILHTAQIDAKILFFCFIKMMEMNPIAFNVYLDKVEER